MADPKTPEKSHKDLPSDDFAESPTTAQPIDFDDDLQETGTVTHDGTVTSTSTPAKPPRTSSRQPPPDSTNAEGDAPAKPPRPMSAREQAEGTLIEAFPSADVKVVRAVLDASGNNVENAFNALLRMTDPEYKEEAPREEQPPPRPPRPNPQRSQLEQDELYARQLAAHYGSAPNYGQAPRGPPSQQRRHHPEEDEEGTTFEDDFAAIGENIKQGFAATQNKLNRWFTDFKKHIDGEDEDEIGPGPANTQRQNFGPSHSRQMQGIKQMGSKPRRSTDQDRYDADPKVLDDNFAELELHDDEHVEEKPPRKPQRPVANPDLFKPTPAAPQSGPVDEVDALYSAPASTNRQPSPSNGGAKSKKWQPLTSVAPAPEADDNDPFSLGDSDDDKEEKKQDLLKEDTERLKKAAANATGPDADAKQQSLETHERAGSNATRDKAAEELLTGKK